MDALWWHVTPSSTGMEADCSCAATEDGVIVSFCWPRQDVIFRAGSRTRHQSELAHTWHLQRKCAVRRVWKTCLVHVRRDAMSDFASSLTWRCVVHARRDATSDFAWRCLVRERRVAMSDFASSLTWYSIGVVDGDRYSIGVVDGDRKVSMEAMVQLAKSMHGEMPCRCFSSSLLGLSTARQTLRPHTLQSLCLESKGGDVDLLLDESTC